MLTRKEKEDVTKRSVLAVFSGCHWQQVNKLLTELGHYYHYLSLSFSLTTFFIYEHFMPLLSSPCPPCPPSSPLLSHLPLGMCTTIHPALTHQWITWYMHSVFPQPSSPSWMQVKGKYSTCYMNYVYYQDQTWLSFWVGLWRDGCFILDTSHTGSLWLQRVYNLWYNWNMGSGHNEEVATFTVIWH